MSSPGVTFAHPPDVVFSYLADPRNRPEWQSSLRSVEMCNEDEPPGEPYLGMRWRDLTSAGVKPLLHITELTPYRVWSETGTWRGVTADLTLRFTAVPAGTRVTVEVDVHGSGLWGVLAPVVRRLAPGVIAHDLARAGRVLGARA